VQRKFFGRRQDPRRDDNRSATRRAQRPPPSSSGVRKPNESPGNSVARDAGMAGLHLRQLGWTAVRFADCGCQNGYLQLSPFGPDVGRVGSAAKGVIEKTRTSLGSPVYGADERPRDNQRTTVLDTYVPAWHGHLRFLPVLRTTGRTKICNHGDSRRCDARGRI